MKINLNHLLISVTSLLSKDNLYQIFVVLFFPWFRFFIDVRNCTSPCK